MNCLHEALPYCHRICAARKVSHPLWNVIPNPHRCCVVCGVSHGPAILVVRCGSRLYRSYRVIKLSPCGNSVFHTILQHFAHHSGCILFINLRSIASIIHNSPALRVSYPHNRRRLVENSVTRKCRISASHLKCARSIAPPAKACRHIMLVLAKPAKMHLFYKGHSVLRRNLFKKLPCRHI